MGWMVGVMGSRWWVRGAPLLVLALFSSASARTAVLKDRARMREGPNSQTALVGQVEAGVQVEIKGDTNGWRQVETPDGKTGYIWGDHLREQPDGEAPPAAAAPAAAPGAEPTRPPDRPAESSPSRGLADEVRALRADVTALRDRPEPASAAWELGPSRRRARSFSTAVRALALERSASTSSGAPRTHQREPITATIHPTTRRPVLWSG